MSRTRIRLTPHSTPTLSAHRTLTGHEDAGVSVDGIDEELWERMKKLAMQSSSKEIAAQYEELERLLLTHRFRSKFLYTEAAYYLSLALPRLPSKLLTIPRLDALSHAHLHMSSPNLRDCVAVTVSAQLALFPAADDAITLRPNHPLYKAFKATEILEKLPPPKHFATLTLRFDPTDIFTPTPAYRCTPNDSDGRELRNLAFSLSPELHPRAYAITSRHLPHLTSRYDYVATAHQTMQPGINRYLVAFNLARMLAKLPATAIPSRHPSLKAVRAEMLAPQPPNDHPEAHAYARLMQKELDEAARKVHF